MPPAPARPGALQTWLQPPAMSLNSTKTKRDHDGDEDVSSVNGDGEKDEQVPAKKTQKKASVKPKVVSKPRSTSKAIVEPANLAKEAKKLYTDKIKDVEERYLDLDKKIKAMSLNSSSTTVENYARDQPVTTRTVHILTAVTIVTSRTLRSYFTSES
ncbi:hypothetical protein LTR78_007750 [Recurvomyces mirabilis]|uniref:Uncharacterized protein n=1 Tax=Recurvomyces mirabilis TaxID=574656 RepID=A0AAE0TRZ6_9PEZI|nr:hypothetical protein LTR78_007750 [Recurvomyces mirabilis]KAK5151638.1 hypothetical protein LTS14_009125 [Recurvomyces mirabilis]